MILANSNNFLFKYDSFFRTMPVLYTATSLLTNAKGRFPGSGLYCYKTNWEQIKTPRFSGSAGKE